VSFHDPKATFRTLSRVQQAVAYRRRRYDRQGSLLPAVTPAAAPLIPDGFAATRERMLHRRPHFRPRPTTVYQRNGQLHHSYEGVLFPTGTDNFTFTGTDGASWGTGWTFTQGSGDILTDRGRMVTGTSAFAGVSAWIDTTLADVTVAIDLEMPTDDAQFPEVRFRFNTGNFDYLRLLFEPHNDIYTVHDYDNDVQQTLLASGSFAFAANDIAHIEFTAVGNNVQLRLWKNAESRPHDATKTFSSSFGATNTQLMVRTVTSNLSVAITNYWDNLSVTAATVLDPGSPLSPDGHTRARRHAAQRPLIPPSSQHWIQQRGPQRAHNFTIAPDTVTGTIAATDQNDTTAFAGTQIDGSTPDGTALFRLGRLRPHIRPTPHLVQQRTCQRARQFIILPDTISGTISVTDQNDTTAFAGTQTDNAIPESQLAARRIARQRPFIPTPRHLVQHRLPHRHRQFVIPFVITGVIDVTDQADTAAIAGDIEILIAGIIAATDGADHMFIQAQRYGKEPDAQRRPTIIFRGRSNRMYYDPNKNPVTGPSSSP